MYTLSVYTSRNTSRNIPKVYRTLSEARLAARTYCKTDLFETGDFHDNPILKGKVAIESGAYPNKSFELWEYILGHDRAPIKTEWSS